MKQARVLKMRAQGIEPSIRIGKQGITAGIVEEIKRQLAKKNMVKIKCLKSFMQSADKKKFAGELAEKTNSKVVHQVGFVIVLVKK